MPFVHGSDKLTKELHDDLSPHFNASKPQRRGKKQSHVSNCNRYKPNRYPRDTPKVSRLTKGADFTRTSFGSEICQEGNRFFIEKATGANWQSFLN